MDQFLRSINRHLQRSRSMEQFVQLIVGGGIALVAGLWIVALSVRWSMPWLLGVSVVLFGIGGLVGGIRSELAY